MGKEQENNDEKESSRNISMDDEIDEALRILDSFKVTINQTNNRNQDIVQDKSN